MGAAIGVGAEDVAGSLCPPGHAAPDDSSLGLRGHSSLRHYSERTVKGQVVQSG